ncbi:hypothetical protein [Azospirillum sp. Marseille-Q6669]
MNVLGTSNLANSSVQSLNSFSQATSASSKMVAGTPAPTDQVSFSPLASALRDESLSAFNALSVETRSQLSSLVDSGALSGDDVHNALKQRTKEARLGAYAATFRMAHNDNADLLSSGSATSSDFQEALRAASEKRAGMMEKLSALLQSGQDGSDDYTALSDQLKALTPNARLLAGGSSFVDPFQPIEPGESRLMSTRSETDAVYKLKAAGVDLSAIDKALRPMGERDAASLVAERAGLPQTHTVSKDGEFSLDQALIQPITAPPSAAGAASGADARFIDADFLANLGSSIGPLKGNAFGEGADASRQYWRGLRASY